MLSEFAVHWQVAAPQIKAVLSAQGISRHVIDDAIQSTAERALKADFGGFESQSHFTAWCIVVARRIVIDDFRRTQREVLAESLPEAVDDRDLVDRVAAILACDLVGDAMSSLSRRELAILFDRSETESRTESVRLAVARHRIRQRLRAASNGLAGVLAGLRRGVWRFFRRASAKAQQGTIAVATGVAIAVLSLATSLAIHLHDLRKHSNEISGPTSVNALMPHVQGARPSVLERVATPPGKALGQRRTLLRVPIGDDQDDEVRVGFGGEAETGKLFCTEQLPDRRLCVNSPTNSVTAALTSVARYITSDGPTPEPLRLRRLVTSEKLDS